MGIFSDNCDKLWAAGLPVMPLRENEKRPFLPGWQNWQAKMPSPPEREAWKRMHSNGNIGLPLGPQSRMFVLDIDTDDERVHALIKQIAPPSPWRRVGKKGAALAFRYTNQPIIRVRYRREDGKAQTLIDMLGAGSQVVLPPSIHPDTMQPYWATADLADVIDDLPTLPVHFEKLLREGLIDLGYDLIGAKDGKGQAAVTVTDFISTGNRDSHLVAMAGGYSRDIMNGRRTLKECLAAIQVAIVTFMERTHGDNMDVAKGPAKLIEFLKRDIHGPMGRPLPRGWDDGMDPDELAQYGLGQADLSADDVTWEADDIRTAFVDAVGKEGVKENPDAFLVVAKEAIARIARNPQMDDLDVESLLKLVVDLSGKQVTLSGVRKQLNRMRAGPVEGLSHSQIAEAALVSLEEIGGEIRAWGEALWQWKGSHWEKMDEREVTKLIIQEYGELKAGLRHSDHNGILKTLKSLRSGDLCRRPGVNGINFVNGFLREDLTLVEHEPDYGMTYCLPYAYEPEKADKCWKFQQMLVDFWGEDIDYAQKVQCLGELMCLTMFGMMTDIQIAVCLYGVAESGKSRLLDIMQGMLPKDVCTSVPPASWGERFSVVHLLGKVLNSAGELSEHAYIDGVRFKTIISGETVDAEEKNQPKFTFRPRCAHWFSSNFLPKSRDSSEGFTRRWVFLYFSRKIDKEKIIPNFDQIVIAEEREAVAAWAVSHMMRLRNENFRITDPISSQEQRASLENELNNVRSFLHDFRENGRMLLGVEDHTKNAPESGTDSKDPASASRTRVPAFGDTTDGTYCTPFDTLYHAYRSYCVAQAVSPVGSKVMMKRMEMLQGTFGFKCDKLKNPAGLFIPVYRYITLVDPSKRKPAKAA